MDTNINLDFDKLHVVPTLEVRPNTWNPKDKDTKEFQEVKASIAENGLRGFIVVRENPSDETKYEIIDGEQRWTACRELGFESVIIYNEGVVDDKRAKELTLWWQVQVPFNDLSLAKLVTNMITEYGSIISPYTQKKIEQMQQLVKFNFDDFKSEVPKTQDADLLKTFSVKVTTAQHEIIQQAIQKTKNTDVAEALNEISSYYLVLNG